jgi:hypothetical protein
MESMESMEGCILYHRDSESEKIHCVFFVFYLYRS